MNETSPSGSALPITIALMVCAFAALGVLFLLAPTPVATFYGIDAGSSAGLFYVRAVGVRDLALAAYLLGLTVARQFQALSIVMFATLVIPVGDILLLAASGASAAGPLPAPCRQLPVLRGHGLVGGTIDQVGMTKGGQDPEF